jgi:transcriptional regulator with XRE-family HTH domain
VNFSDRFAQRLRRAREIRKMTQREIAERTGLPPSLISHFENGTRCPAFENLRRLALSLEVSADYLLGLSEIMEMRLESPAFNANALTFTNRELVKGFIQVMLREQDREAGKLKATEGVECNGTT